MIGATTSGKPVENQNISTLNFKMRYLSTQYITFLDW